MGHERLRRSPDVRAVLRRGRRWSRPLVVVHARTRNDDAPARVAVVASRRVGTAVQRNRAKRVLRAAVADVALPRGVDLALVARSTTPGAHSDDARRDLIDILEHMFDLPDEGSRVAAARAGGGRD